MVETKQNKKRKEKKRKKKKKEKKTEINLYWGITKIRVFVNDVINHSSKILLLKRIYDMRSRGKHFLDSDIAKYSKNLHLRNDVQDMTNNCYFLLNSLIKSWIFLYSKNIFELRHSICHSSAHSKRFRDSPFMCHFSNRWSRFYLY